MSKTSQMDKDLLAQKFIDQEDCAVSKVLRDVPVPRRQSCISANFPFADLDVGDCFMVTELKETTERRLRSSAFNTGRRLERKFTCRRIDDSTVGVWRVE
jgi:hypothetical protein